MTLYKNKYRVESTRMPGWDYSSAGFYFVTICTKWRTNDFGKIVDDKMILNDYGIIANDEWEQTFQIQTTGHKTDPEKRASPIIGNYVFMITLSGMKMNCNGSGIISNSIRQIGIVIRSTLIQT